MNFDRVLALVSATLYGIPNQLGGIEALAAERGVFMLDDAAQALGARCAGRAVGGFGDAGLYSFDKGKNITTMQGGAIVARAGALAGAIEKEQRALARGRGARNVQPHAQARALWRAAAARTVRRRAAHAGAWAGPHDLRNADPDRAQFSPSLAGLALRLARRLDAINAARIGNAASLESALATATGIRLPEISPDAQPVFARFPVFVNDAARRPELVRALNAAGIGATTSYPEALANVPQVNSAALRRGCAARRARRWRARVVTLPTHGYSPADLGQRVRAIVDRDTGKVVSSDAASVPTTWIKRVIDRVAVLQRHRVAAGRHGPAPSHGGADVSPRAARPNRAPDAFTADAIVVSAGDLRTAHAIPAQVLQPGDRRAAARHARRRNALGYNAVAW